MTGQSIRVGEGDYAGSDNAAIQRAVDATAARGGGTVELPAGTFVLRDSVHLRSGVALVGQGTDTVLLKAPSVASALAGRVIFGHCELLVERPDLFEPGMGVTVQDADATCIYTTVGTVVERHGHSLYIDRPVNHDYNPHRDGRVVGIFPLVSAGGVRDVRIADLRLDGADDAEPMNGCRGGGVFAWDARNVVVENVEVLRYNGDAVSFQKCIDVVVRRCHVHGNTGCGLHPGCGSVRYLFADNDVHDNGGDGLFYCVATTHSLCQGNSFRHNGAAGISVGDRDTDHLIRRNEVRDNGGPGIRFREVPFQGGDRTVVEQNVLSGNCTDSGDAQIVIGAGLRDVTLRGNRFEGLAGMAVELPARAEAIHLIANRVDGGECGPGHVRDPAGLAVFGEREEPLRVGPRAAGPRAARHLGPEPLPPLPAGLDGA